MAEFEQVAVLEFMDLLLEVVVEEFQALGITLPARRYVTHGQTAADCDQLTVSLIQLYRGEPAAPADEPTSCNSRTSAVIEVELLRKVPNVGDTRTGVVQRDALDAAGRQHITDASALLTSMCRLSPPRYFFSHNGFFGDVTTGDTQGDYAGPKLTITAAVG